MDSFDQRNQNVGTQYNVAGDAVFGDDPFVVDEYIVKETEITKIRDKFFVRPKSWEKLVNLFSRYSVLCIVGPPGIGKRTIALKLAHEFAKSRESIFIISRYIPWSKLKNVDKSESIFILPDALSVVNSESTDVDAELGYLERLVIQGNRIIMTSTPEIFPKAKNTGVKLDEFIAKSGVIINFTTTEFDFDLKIEMFKKKIAYAHSEMGTISSTQKSWGMALVEDPSDTAPERRLFDIVGNRSVFNKQLESSWLPIDIDQFVRFSLRQARKPRDMIDSLRNDTDIDSRVQAWFIGLDDSIRCFILSLVMFVGAKEDKVWESYKEIVLELRKLNSTLTVLPIRTDRTKLYPYITEVGLIDFISPRVNQAVINTIRKSYIEYFYELAPLVEKWSIPNVSGLIKELRNRKFDETEWQRNKIARIIGTIAQGNPDRALPIIENWAGNTFGTIGKTAGIALSETCIDSSSKRAVRKILDKWATNYSPENGRYFRWSAASALWRITSSDGDSIDFALKLLQKLVSDHEDYVVSSATHALGKMVNFFETSQLAELLTKIAERSSVSTWRELLQILDDKFSDNYGISTIYVLIENWLNNDKRNVRLTGVYVLMASRKLDTITRLQWLQGIVHNEPDLFAQMLNRALKSQRGDESDSEGANQSDIDPTLELLANDSGYRTVLIASLASLDQSRYPMHELRNKFLDFPNDNISSIPSDIDEFIQNEINDASDYDEYNVDEEYDVAETHNHYSPPPIYEVLDVQQHRSNGYKSSLLLILLLLCLFPVLYFVYTHLEITSLVTLNQSRVTVPNTGIDWQEIDDTIRRWDDVHHYADNTLDASTLDSVLTGQALNDQINIIDGLRRDSCNWTFVDLSPSKMVENSILSSTEVVVKVQKHWDSTLHCKNKSDSKPLKEYFTATYTMVKTDAGWRISIKGSD